MTPTLRFTFSTEMPFSQSAIPFFSTSLALSHTNAISRSRTASYLSSVDKARLSQRAHHNALEAYRDVKVENSSLRMFSLVSLD